MEDFSIGDMFDGKKNKKPLSKKEKMTIFIGIIIGILIVFCIIIIIVLANSKRNDEDKEPEKDKIGEIYCIYDITTTKNPTKLLGDEFNNKDSDFSIYINGELIKYSKEYQFKQVGKYNIKYVLHDKISMDYMFKNVNSLLSVDMASEKNAEIKSMISTFENCEN
jgi:preprotein translocase subunit SecG